MDLLAEEVRNKMIKMSENLLLYDRYLSQSK